METKLNINPEELITLVEERGVLWDKTLNEYKDKQLKISAWREVCCLLIPGFDKFDEKERQKYGKLVSAKWSNIRDAWTRANRNDVKKSGVRATFSKPYIYKKQMSFLQKVVEPNRTHDSARKRPTDMCSEASAATHTSTSLETLLPSNSKKQKKMTLDEKSNQFLDSRLPTDKEVEHPMLSFFKGILPSVTSFDDDETLELQSGVLSLIRNIKKQRNNRLYSENYGWHPQSREYMQRSRYLSQTQTVHSLGNQSIHLSDGLKYSPRHSLEPESPSSTWSQQSSPTQDSDLNSSNF